MSDPLTDIACTRCQDHGWTLDDQRRLCPTREPEPHELGEFPMTCYRCHLEADQ